MKVGQNAGCFADFCHHHLAITSVHTHAYRYPLKVEGKQICEQSLYVYVYTNTKNNSKVDF